MAAIDVGGDSDSRVRRRWGGHGEGLRRSRGDAAGVKLGGSPSTGGGERGNRLLSPSRPRIWRVVGRPVVG